MNKHRMILLLRILALAVTPVGTLLADDVGVDPSCVFVPIPQESWSFRDGVLTIDAKAACEPDYRLPRPLLWRPRQPGEKFFFGLEIPAQHCAAAKPSLLHYEYTTEQLGLNPQQSEAVQAVGESLFAPLKDWKAYADLLAHAREREATKEHPNAAILNLKPCAESAGPKP